MVDLFQLYFGQIGATNEIANGLEMKGKAIEVMLPDTAERYLSSELFAEAQ